MPRFTYFVRLAQLLHRRRRRTQGVAVSVSVASSIEGTGPRPVGAYPRRSVNHVAGHGSIASYRAVATCLGQLRTVFFSRHRHGAHGLQQEAAVPEPTTRVSSAHHAPSCRPPPRPRPGTNIALFPGFAGACKVASMLMSPCPPPSPYRLRPTSTKHTLPLGAILGTPTASTTGNTTKRSNCVRAVACRRGARTCDNCMDLKRC